MTEPPAEDSERPGLRIAEPPVEAEGTVADVDAAAALHDARRDAEADAEMADRQAAEQARVVEEAADSALQQLRQRTEAASRELGRRREELEAEAQRREEGRSLPGAGSLGFELAMGALRLVGAMVTAPVRIGLAFLRPREA